MELSIVRAKQLKPKPDETHLGFGTKFTDHMFNMDYAPDKGWHHPRIEPYGPITMDPATMVLHYGQGVFEGLKAYRTSAGRIQLFRPLDNLRRLNRSNDILCIPRIDETFALEALKKSLVYFLNQRIVITWNFRVYGYQTTVFIEGVQSLSFKKFKLDRGVGEEFVAAGSALAVAEMLRGGTTCFNDMYFFPQVTGRVAAAAGMRAVIGLIVIDFPSAWAADTDAYFSRAIDTFDELKGHPLVSTAFAPHAPYSVGDAPLARVRKLADELDLPVHMHVHETRDEVDQQTQRYGKRPLARLDALGLVSPGLVAVHMTQLDDSEIALCADRGVQIVHCPESNLKLASGFCPVQRLLGAGINVALGTDGAASNNDLDMLGELRTAALLAKAVSGDASAVPAYQALRMATLGGARALSLDERIGSIVAGKEADLIAVDMGELADAPVYDPISHLVHVTSRERVTDVWIGGERIVCERRLTTVDVAALAGRVRLWQQKLA